MGPSNVLSMAQLRTLPLGDQVKTLMKNGMFTEYIKSAHQDLLAFDILGFDIYLVTVFSQGHAICQSDGAACVRHRLHCSAALHTAGGDARPGKLGCQEVWCLS